MASFKLIFISLFLCSISYGQSDTLNQTNSEGKKEGYWIIYGKMDPAKGFCDSCKVEEGNYIDSRKEGTWTKYYPNGNRRLVGFYKRQRPHGEYTKYWKNGIVKETGRYEERLTKGPKKVYNEKGQLTQSKNYNNDGQEDGWITYYYETCDSLDTLLHKNLEYLKINGIIQGNFIKYYYSGCVKEMRPYDNEGQPLKMIVYNNDCNILDSIKFGTEGKGESEYPCGDVRDNGIPPRPPGDHFRKNGYNKLYNKNDDLWMEGYFKNAKLYNGRLYVYDNDGLFIKLEIWEEGAFLKIGDIDYLETIKIPDYIKGKYPPGDEEIYMDGEYRDGKLWNGKKYNYDSDGILVNIEIWKRGKFVENGTLDVSNDGYKNVPTSFDPPYNDGYHMVYDKNDEIWLEGEFKDNKFWKGKHYIYGEDGLLERIEVWVNGKYHSDAQL